ncbi:conserved hypothetical protein [Talaromyces stipitatus ATCC 10500]|uniref:NAD(P)-binding domain-containing protein n=1 Tax=Talaromyces stipitatus (strain ATCC 10500 / CBS 375.48 / QM 6759 / NRRL 1006) TaxID=441959 RepID=B8MLS9_TALSN|nr:uncharacterized protein TSTA_100410 [Talaromyces stipitatus ATCC 10500]EED13796.1 conserved hypothetical protein [Talaromyces stipitatus ATCC 10500]
MTSSSTYTVLGSTGRCGRALIQTLLDSKPDARIHAYCRDRTKLLRLLPDIKEGGEVEILKEASTTLTFWPRVCVVATRSENTNTAPRKVSKLVLLSSATIDDHFLRHLPYLLRLILLRSAFYVYIDPIETEKMLHAEEDWLKTIFIKPGALSVDVQRGHALSLTDEQSPVSYLDLAAAMIEAADDENGSYDLKNMSVINTNGAAKFPTGTPMHIALGLLRHILPLLHPYLPLNTGPG